MAVVRGFSSPIGHGENDSRTDGSGELDGLFDLLVSRSELLRTCEVRNRSRFAMQSEDKCKVHQLLGLGVQGASRMNLLEVVRVALARVEITAPEFRHFSPHQNGAGNELEGDLPTTRPRVPGVSCNRQRT